MLRFDGPRDVEVIIPSQIDAKAKGAMSHIVTVAQSGSLPKDWWRAPCVWRKQDPDAFWIFVVVNFFFGTLGIWLPLINALLGGHTAFCEELLKLFAAGGFYMYAVPLLAATVGVVFPRTSSWKTRA